MTEAKERMLDRQYEREERELRNAPLFNHQRNNCTECRKPIIDGEQRLELPDRVIHTACIPKEGK